MFIKGMDFSSLCEQDGLSAVIKNADGVTAPLCETLTSYGVNSARLRLWVNPYDESGAPYGGGTCDYNALLYNAREAKRFGMSILLDLHYSDFWTDPGKQTKPKAWRNLSFSALTAAVHDYTADVLKRMDDDGIFPDAVQIGNEITSGMLWPDGKLFCGNLSAEFDRLCVLLNSGLSAVAECGKPIKTVLHLERSGDVALYEEWLSNVLRRGIKFDALGVSYYPYWHGNLSALKTNLVNVMQKFEMPVFVAETSYGFTVEDFSAELMPQNYTELAAGAGVAALPEYPMDKHGQAKFIKALMTLLDEIGAFGFYWWEPAWTAVKGGTWASEAARRYIDEAHKGNGNEWANQCLFDYDGMPNPALDEIKRFTPRVKR